jgi:NAD-dependent dihydropyrimidine dehydrogenase PreA subunit
MLFYVDPKKCSRDKICVGACGRRLIEMGGNRLSANPDS